MEKLIEFKKKLLKLKIDNGLSRLTDFSQIKKTRKNIARELTKLNSEKKQKKHGKK